MFQDCLKGGLPLRMQGIETDQFAVHIEFAKQFTRSGDFVGFVFDDVAAEIMLAGRGDGRQDIFTATVFGYFTVDTDQVIFRRVASQLPLPLD